MLNVNFNAFTFMGMIAISTAAPVYALQPQPGSYWGGGSRYITIIRRQDRDRLCYQGSSPNGTVVASLVPVRENPRLYAIYGFGAIALKQQNTTTLFLGQLATTRTALVQPAPYRLEGLATLTYELKQCLNANTPFYRAILLTQ